MIIPLSEHQLRTYLDTGKVTVEIPVRKGVLVQLDRRVAIGEEFYTVATIAFERRGDRWAWIVGLEAENAD